MDTKKEVNSYNGYLRAFRAKISPGLPVKKMLGGKDVNKQV